MANHAQFAHKCTALGYHTCANLHSDWQPRILTSIATGVREPVVHRVCKRNAWETRCAVRRGRQARTAAAGGGLTFGNAQNGWHLILQALSPLITGVRWVSPGTAWGTWNTVFGGYVYLSAHWLAWVVAWGEFPCFLMFNVVDDSY